MIRSQVAAKLSRTFPRLTIPLVVLGLVFAATLPLLNSRRTYISEGGLKVGSFALCAQQVSLSSCKWTEMNRTRRVKGARSIGNDAVLILVGNSTFSHQVASCLLELVQSKRFLMTLSYEIIISTTASAKQLLREKRVRAAVVLNITNPEDGVCAQTQGNSGLQPNLDLVNVLLKMMRASGLDTSLCSAHAQTLSNAYGGFMTSGILSPRNALDELRAAGIHTVGLASDEKRRVERFSTSTRQLLGVLEGLLRAINNLEEKLHHSYFVWFLIDADHFVDFEVAQHVVSLCALSMLSQLFLRQRLGQRSILLGPSAALVLGAASSHAPHIAIKFTCSMLSIWLLSYFQDSTLFFAALPPFIAVLTVLHASLSLVLSITFSVLLALVLPLPFLCRCTLTRLAFFLLLDFLLRMLTLWRDCPGRLFG